MLYSSAFSFSGVYSLGFGFLARLRLSRLRWLQAFLASSACAVRGNWGQIPIKSPARLCVCRPTRFGKTRPKPACNELHAIASQITRSLHSQSIDVPTWTERHASAVERLRRLRQTITAQAGARKVTRRLTPALGVKEQPFLTATTENNRLPAASAFGSPAILML